MPLLNRRPEEPEEEPDPQQYVEQQEPERTPASKEADAAEPSEVGDELGEMVNMEVDFQKQWQDHIEAKRRREQEEQAREEQNKDSVKKEYSPKKQDTTDRVLDGVVEVGVSQGECPDDKPESPIGDSTMAVPAEIHEQNLARLAGAGAQAHEHFVQFGKILDLSYEQDRKMVSLVESLGVREVTSQAGQTGIPLAGGKA